jgi:hypothetical protein
MNISKYTIKHYMYSTWTSHLTSAEEKIGERKREARIENKK